MKKVIFTLVALLAVTFTMSAGNKKVRFSEDADLAFGNDFFVVEPISYLGFGYHLKNSQMDIAQDAANTEFFINIMELGIRPFKGGMFAIGVDYDLDQYRLDKNHFWGAETGKNAWIRSLGMSPYKSVKYSRLNVHTFSIPVSFEFDAGKCAFRLGAAGEYNLPAVNKEKLVKSEGGIVKNKIKNIPVNEFSYSFFGSISYGGLGVYVKYNPVCQFAEGSGPSFKTLTLGAVIGLGM